MFFFRFSGLPITGRFGLTFPTEQCTQKKDMSIHHIRSHDWKTKNCQRAPAMQVYVYIYIYLCIYKYINAYKYIYTFEHVYMKIFGESEAGSNNFIPQMFGPEV